MDGPVNTLAQLILWKIEGDVAAWIVVAIFACVWMLVYALGGDTAGQWVVNIFFIGCGLAVPGFLLWGLYEFLSPAARDRALDRVDRRADAIRKRNWAHLEERGL